MRVLFVCTANTCRSPLAAGLFVHAAAQRELDDAVVASAGFLEAGRPAHDHVVRILEDRGVDMSRKRSRQLRAHLVLESDVVLTMTSDHARRLVARVPESVDRVFTVRDFVNSVSPRPEGRSIRRWLQELDDDHPRSYRLDDDRLDIPDPIGLGYPVYAELADELSTSISWILDCAYPPTS